MIEHMSCYPQHLVHVSCQDSILLWLSILMTTFVRTELRRVKFSASTRDEHLYDPSKLVVRFQHPPSNRAIGKPSLLDGNQHVLVIHNIWYMCLVKSRDFVSTVWHVTTLNHEMYLIWFSLHHRFHDGVRSTCISLRVSLFHNMTTKCMSLNQYVYQTNRRILIEQVSDCCDHR